MPEINLAPAWTALTVMHEILVVLAVVSILRRPREPRAMWAWILAVVFLPVAGLLLFVLVGEPRLRRTRRRRRRRRMRIMHALRQIAEVRAGSRAGMIQAGDPAVASLIHLTTRVGELPPTAGNEVVIYQDAEKTFLALSLAIQSARDHIHLEYYIFQSDETGAAIRDMLIAKAREGVQVRLLLDYIGSFSLFKRFIWPMRRAGIEVAFFMPLVLWRGRWRMNFRNHRKIVVIDGRIGFTGSQNIGDEYAGRRKGPQWRDTHMKIEGPAVHHLQEVFIEDWHFASRRPVVGHDYFKAANQPADQLVHVIPSGPDRDVDVLHQLLLGAVGTARSSLDIATPYFVPDITLILALQSAAYRGVRVRLLIPANTDHKVVLWAGRTYYRQLCRAGVEIHEYDRGMLHSKVLIIDKVCAIVGSANFDERSLRLNFEVSMMLYDQHLTAQLHSDFEELRLDARQVHPQRHVPLFESLKLGLARLISPLL